MWLSSYGLPQTQVTAAGDAWKNVLETLFLDSA